jgi:lysophospholipase
MVNDRIRWRSHPKDASFGACAAPDGLALRKMDWPRGKGKKARGSLLFAGGRGDFIEKYLETFAHWRAAGWNVTAFDWRGQGGSQGEGAEAALEDFEILVDDLAALLASWRGQVPGPHVAVAHSMGGHVLLRTLVDRQPALDAAVLVAPMILVNSGPIPSWLAPDVADTMCWLGLRTQPMWKTPTALTRPGSQRQRLLTGSRERYEDELFWWGREPTFNLGPPSWGWAREAYRSAALTFTPERLAGVDLPILILATDRDRLVSPAAIRRVAAALPRAELEMIPGAAHEILREADPVRDWALARIDAFLDRFAG